MGKYKIIALSGKKYSGKDTTADYLVKKANYVKLSFVATLKDMVAEQYNIPREYLDNTNQKEVPLLQYPVESRDAFSKVIHDTLKDEFKEVKEEFGDSVEYVKYWTPRALAILEGSIKRSVNTGYWTNRVINKIKHELYQNPFAKFVISDLRYKSEAEQLKKAFGEQVLLCRVHRPQAVASSTDPSEVDLDNYVFDCAINNSTSIYELEALIDMILVGR